MAALIGLIAACSETDGEVRAPKQPNLILIIMDDQRYDALGCAGNPLLATPHLDRIAEQGAYFENSFVVSPICSPSRASILTGTYGSVNGVLSTELKGDVLRDHTIFPELLQRHGYETAFIGKWHLPNPGANPYRGFDHWVSFEGQGSYVDQALNVDGVSVPGSGYLADALASHAIEWMKRPRTKPFCLILSFKNPHFPYIPAPRRQGALSDAAIALPASMADPADSQPAFVRLIRASPRMIRLPEQSAQLVLTLRRYYETIVSVDDNVGLLLAALEQSGKLDTTCILMTSDNGILLGEHGLVQKNRSYEESIRVPLLVRYPPEIKRGSRFSEPVLNIDLAPTLLDLAGVEASPAMQGENLRGLWTGRTSSWRDATLHVEPPRSGNEEPAGLSIRTNEWKYVRYRSAQIEEVLFDLEHDEGERINVASVAAHGSVLVELRARMKARMEQLLMPPEWWDPCADAAASTDD